MTVTLTGQVTTGYQKRWRLQMTQAADTQHAFAHGFAATPSVFFTHRAQGDTTDIWVSTDGTTITINKTTAAGATCDLTVEAFQHSILSSE